ncbi:MAG: hypothetical protein CR972_00425 [Candidatus Moraniibacteriota bacterium]|nr:MAG: hypothetical protein CR972_00425 [Candidatus Moranbacteria bacterium]
MAKRMYTEYARDRAIQLLSFLGFTFGITVALLAYVISSYFQKVIESDNVSGFYIGIFFVILVSLFKLNRIIERIGRAKTLMILLVVQIGVLFALQFFEISWFGAFLLMIYYVLYGIIWVVFDVILEAYSEDSKTGRVRGAYLSVLNLGFLIGPIISTSLLDIYGFHIIFTITTILYVFIFLAVFVALNDIRGHVVKKNLSSRKVFDQFRTNQNLIFVYGASFALRFFYATMVIYMPLYLRSIDVSWSEIGIMFSIMLIPFSIIQYPAGVLADKKYGEKEMLFIGFIIMAGSLIVMYFLNEPDFVLWTVVLFVSRIGAALVEAMLDSYFYKQINENDIAIINFFRTTRAVAYILSSLFIGALLMIVSDLHIVFIASCIMIIFGIIVIIPMEDTVPDEK